MTGEDRRSAIAAAAIELVAQRGIRALTHRGIDQWMGLPEGSTSYYMRTRRALITAMVDEVRRHSRMAAAYLLEVERRPDPVTPDGLAAIVTRYVVAGMTTYRSEVAAWYALAVELTGDPELHELITSRSPLREPLLRVLGAQLGRLGVQDCARRAADLSAICDGLLFDRIAGSRSTEQVEPAELHDQVAEVFGGWIRGILATERDTAAPPAELFG